MRLYLALSVDFQTEAGTKHIAQMASVVSSDDDSEVINASDIMEIVKRYKPAQMLIFTDKIAAVNAVKAWNKAYTANGVQMWND